MQKPVVAARRLQVGMEGVPNPVAPYLFVGHDVTAHLKRAENAVGGGFGHSRSTRQIGHGLAGMLGEDFEQVEGLSQNGDLIRLLHHNFRIAEFLC